MAFRCAALVCVLGLQPGVVSVDAAAVAPRSPQPRPGPEPPPGPPPRGISGGANSVEAEITHAIVPTSDGLVYGATAPDAVNTSSRRFGYAVAGGSGARMTPVKIAASLGTVVTAVGNTRLVAITGIEDPRATSVALLRGAAGRYSSDRYAGIVAAKDTLFFLVGRDGGFTKWELRAYNDFDIIFGQLSRTS